MNDTSPAAQRVHLALLREAGVGRRLALMRNLSASVVEMARTAIARSHPRWSATEVNLEFVRLNYGKGLADQVRRYLEEHPRALC